MAPERYVAWRRRKGTREPWQKDTTIPAGTRGDVFQAVGERELRGAEDMIWEYQVTPEGQRPQQQYETFSKRLRNGR